MAQWVWSLPAILLARSPDRNTRSLVSCLIMSRKMEKDPSKPAERLLLNVSKRVDGVVGPTALSVGLYALENDWQ